MHTRPASKTWVQAHNKKTDVRDARPVMHAGVANWRFPLKSVAGKTFGRLHCESKQDTLNQLEAHGRYISLAGLQNVSKVKEKTKCDILNFSCSLSIVTPEEFSLPDDKHISARVKSSLVRMTSHYLLPPIRSKWTNFTVIAWNYEDVWQNCILNVVCKISAILVQTSVC